MRPLPWVPAAVLILILSVGAGLAGSFAVNARTSALVYVAFLPLAYVGGVLGKFIHILPIVVVYPSLQKYFVKGVTVGSVKG